MPHERLHFNKVSYFLAGQADLVIQVNQGDNRD